MTVSLPPAFSTRGLVDPPEVLERGHIRPVMLRDVRGLPGHRQVLGRLAPDVGHRLDLDGAALREVRERTGPQVAGQAPAAADHAADVVLHIFLADPAARSAAADLGDVHAEFAGELPDRRGGRDERAGPGRGRRPGLGRAPTRPDGPC